MSPLQLRVSISMIFIVTASVVVGFLGIHTYITLTDHTYQMRQSFLLQNMTTDLPGTRYSKRIADVLKAYRASLRQEERAELLSDVIQSYNHRSLRLLKKRVRKFLRGEKSFVIKTEPQVTYLEKRILYYGTIWFVLILIGLIYLRVFLSRRVFDPIQETTVRMNDFLNGKYAYQFAVPVENEMGALQTSFNSMAQEVIQNMDELKNLDAAKSDFLNIASHELRTPMTSIKGSLGLMTSGVMGDLDTQVLRLVRIAETETDRLIRLTNDILDMAKIEARSLPLKEDWTPLRAMLDRPMKSLHGLSETSEVKIKIRELPVVEVFADKDRIHQILTNLLSNAIKFSPKGGTVEITAHEDVNNHIRFEIKDKGNGISNEDQHKIFDKFRQATGPDNPLVKGTGLGLAIAKALVEEHKGTIGVHSRPGKGSSFYFTLPTWRPIDMAPDNVVPISKSKKPTSNPNKAAA